MSWGSEGDCKDFIKGVCFRGNKCKYRHSGEMSEPDSVPFCKDFMNERGCHFENENGRECSFVHAPMAAVQEYNKTGWLPNFIVTRITERFQICGNFLKTSCHRRADECKYKHVKLGIVLANSEDILSVGDQMVGAGFETIMRKFGICRDYAKDGCLNSEADCKYKHRNPVEVNLGNHSTTWRDVLEREQNMSDSDRNYHGMEYGRGQTDLRMGMMGRRGMGSGMGGYDCMDRMGMNGGGGKRMRVDDMGGSDMSLRGENQMLRIENEQLRIKVQELTATNKFLLEQNAEVRMQQMSGSYR